MIECRCVGLGSGEECAIMALVMRKLKWSVDN